MKVEIDSALDRVIHCLFEIDGIFDNNNNNNDNNNDNNDNNNIENKNKINNVEYYSLCDNKNEIDFENLKIIFRITVTWNISDNNNNNNNSNDINNKVTKVYEAKTVEKVWQGFIIIIILL